MQIPTDLLKAAILFAAKKDFRVWLNGVHIDWQHRKAGQSTSISIVATDSHRLFAAKFSNEHVQSNLDAGSAIIDAAQVKLALTGHKGDTIGFAFDADTRTGALGNLAVEGMDATYPDWRKVIPESVSGEVSHFDAAYVGDMAKAAKLLLPKGTYQRSQSSAAFTHPNGYEPALVTFGEREDVLAVLMPCRHEFDFDQAARIAQSIAA